MLAVASPSVAAELDDDARHRVEGGQTVVEMRPADGFSWPEAIAWRRVAAAPATVMAVYADLDSQDATRRLRVTIEALAARVERLAADEPDHLRHLALALSAMFTR